MFYTDRQIEIIEFIRQYRRMRRVSPTLEEIAQHFGVTRVTIHDHVRQLEKKGALRKVPHLARSLEIVDENFQDEPQAASGEGQLPVDVLGNIAAGEAIEAIEVPESFDLAELVPTGGESYALRVRGNSMIDDGIHDGDLVIVEHRTVAQDGETVVAIIGDNEATLKRIYREPDGRFRLQPANESLDPIFTEKVEVRGVVVSVVRRVGLS